jgi:hypothetical protein
MKITIFFIIASFALIKARPDVLDKVSYASSSTLSLAADEDINNCYIVHLKKRGLFTPEFNPVPSSNVLFNCEGTLDTHRQSVVESYTKIFSKNPNTKDYVQCIMTNFKNTEGNELILLNLVYDDARVKGLINKKSYCKMTWDSKQKIEELLRANYKACNPGSDLDNIFTFNTECEDPRKS